MLYFVGVAIIVNCPLSVVNSSEPLKPLLPMQVLPSFPEESLEKNSAQPVATATVRGQVTPSFSELEDILKTPPPHAQGPIDSAAVEPKLIEQTSAEIPSLLSGTAAALLPNAGVPFNGGENGVREVPKIDQFAYGTLLFATAVTTIGLIYMVFVAYDYRQRWMQSLTTQNERFTGGSFDGEYDDVYGTPHYV